VQKYVEPGCRPAGREEQASPAADPPGSGLARGVPARGSGLACTWFNMWKYCGASMEIIVIEIESEYAAAVEELRRRGAKVVLVPGNALAVYAFHSGFQELDGDAAKLYISSLLESAYFIEYY